MARRLGMNIRYFLTASICFAGVVLSGCTPAKPTAGNLSCDKFPDTYTLDNGTVKVVVAPQIGRIVGYYRLGQPNMLWVDKLPTKASLATAAQTWGNYGGARLWITPEGQPRKDALGRWGPADETFDNKAWIVKEASPRKLVMASEISPYQGVRATQTISLPDKSTTVCIEYSLAKVSGRNFPVHVWPVVQVKLPQYALLDWNQQRCEIQTFNGKWSKEKLMQSPEESVLRFDYPACKAKVGSYGRWVAGVYENEIFAVYVQRLSITDKYADNASCEIYVEPKLNLMELEVLSPCRKLSIGGRINFNVIWKLLPNDKNDLDSIIEKINISSL